VSAPLQRAVQLLRATACRLLGHTWSAWYDGSRLASGLAVRQCARCGAYERATYMDVWRRVRGLDRP
jgi:hypothetical protein